MARFVELTADDLLGSKVHINPDRVSMIAPDTYDKTKLAIDGMIIVVKETRDMVVASLSN